MVSSVVRKDTAFSFMAREFCLTPQPLDPTITGFTVRDLRFPTSLDAIGSDPMK